MMAGAFGIVMGIVCVGVIAVFCLPMMVRMFRRPGHRDKTGDEN